jgi:hypothetical protein
VTAVIVNLNHHATYVHFHVGGGHTPFFVFQMSLSNVLVIVAMLVLFVLAIVLPFPGGASATRRGGASS